MTYNMVERIINNFRHTSVYASYKGAFETIPMWFKLNKDKSVAMRQMVEFVVPTTNVLRYHHFVECNDSVHEYIETHKHDSVMSASDIYELLSCRFPMQVGNMVLTACCSASKECDFAKMFDALANRDKDAFCESASDVLPRLSGLVEAWREVYTPFRVWSVNDTRSADADAESLIQSLCNILDRCDEKSFGEMKDNLFRCHFTVRADEVSRDGMQELASLAMLHFNSIYTILYHNVYRLLEPEWFEDNPWLESLLIECRRQYKIVWEVDCKPNLFDSGSEIVKIDLSKFGEPNFNAGGTHPKHVRRRKVSRPISLTASKPEVTNVEEVSCYYIIDAPETDDGDGFVQEEKKPSDGEDANNTVPPKIISASSNTDPLFDERLKSEKAQKMFEKFIDEGYIVQREDGFYNWQKTQALCVYFAECASDFLGLTTTNISSWKPFQNVFFFFNRATGKWTEQRHNFSSRIQNQPSPMGAKDINEIFEKLKKDQ